MTRWKDKIKQPKVRSMVLDSAGYEGVESTTGGPGLVLEWTFSAGDDND